MHRSNFRIKLDLSNFYSDVRRFCWIFIDGSKMLQITHMKEHITKLFNIKEPFHLLLNETEYLPPNEDIRILKENETILVSAGSGLRDELDSAANIVTLSEERDRQEVEYNCLKLEEVRNSVQHKQLQTALSLISSSPVQEAVSSDIPNQSQNDPSESIMSCEMEDSEVSSITESKSINTNVYDIAENFMKCPKRKRVRHRRKKMQEVQQPVTKQEEKQFNKPKIINSYTVSSGKHIRFDNLDNDEIIEEQLRSPEIMNGANTSKTSPSHKLANLLVLGKSSIPLTFTNTRIKQEIKIEHMSDEDSQCNAFSENTSENMTVINKLEERNESLNNDFETYPILTTEPRVKDVIAFKMLKIGSDYTPQISSFIIAEVIACCPKTSTYTFKVSEGLSEVQVPVGKFTVIEEDEEHEVDDTITLNSAQIMQPRLISRHDSDKTNSS